MVFLCKSCKPCSTSSRRTAPKPLDGFKCDHCDFKTAFKYNLQRHVENKHTGEADFSVNQITESTEANEEELGDADISNVVDSNYSLTNMLKELDLENLLENFVSDGVDLAMLLSFNNTDMKECMKDIGIRRFGDRHRIVEKVVILRRNQGNKFQKPPNATNLEAEGHEETTVDTDENSYDGLLESIGPANVTNHEAEGNEETVVEIPDDDEHTDDVLLENIDPEMVMEARACCPLCLTSKHSCRKCNKTVCNLYCSEQDPSSDSEMYRVHRIGDIRCVSLGFECPTCGETFQVSSALQKHMTTDHEHETSGSILSEANSSNWMYVPCTVCAKRFENESDMKHHNVRVHEYGEDCRLYPCEECGFSGQDIDELKSHVVEVHENLSEKTYKHMIKHVNLVMNLLI